MIRVIFDTKNVFKLEPEFLAKHFSFFRQNNFKNHVDLSEHVDLDIFLYLVQVLESNVSEIPMTIFDAFRLEHACDFLGCNIQNIDRYEPVIIIDWKNKCLKIGDMIYPCVETNSYDIISENYQPHDFEEYNLYSIADPKNIAENINHALEIDVIQQFDFSYRIKYPHNIICIETLSMNNNNVEKESTVDPVPLDVLILKEIGKIVCEKNCESCERFFKRNHWLF